jgi:hypothetical protein
LALASLTVKVPSVKPTPSVALAHANVIPLPFTLAQSIKPWEVETSIPTGRCAAARSGTISSSNAAASTIIQASESRAEDRLQLGSVTRVLTGGIEGFIESGYQ